MQKQPAGLAVGQDWAYRAKRSEPLTPVRVTKLGARKPARVKVSFLDDRFEGREEWVPAPRLKVPWDQVGQWQAREERWAAVETASSSSYDTPEYWAASKVLERLPDELIEVNYRGGGGYVVISDREGLLRLIGGDEALLADPVAFVDEDDGSYVAPWAVTERLALYLTPFHGQATGGRGA